MKETHELYKCISNVDIIGNKFNKSRDVIQIHEASLVSKSRTSKK
jgi:hypothetical protein